MLSFFPIDVLDEIWDLIESVSEGFLTYFCLAIPPVLITSFLSTSKGDDSLNYYSMFSVCSKSV